MINLLYICTILTIFSLGALAAPIQGSELYKSAPPVPAETGIDKRAGFAIGHVGLIDLLEKRQRTGNSDAADLVRGKRQRVGEPDVGDLVSGKRQRIGDADAADLVRDKRQRIGDADVADLVPGNGRKLPAHDRP